MKTLLILRHAKSDWNNNLPDHDRPLNKRGKADAPRLGALLRREDIVPDLIISSTAKRALVTATAVADASGYEGELKVTREFYHASAEAYVSALQTLPASYKRVMVVGHNPGMAELVEDLTDQSVRMPTAALAMVQLPIKEWQELDRYEAGKLVNYWEPRRLPK